MVSVPSSRRRASRASRSSAVHHDDAAHFDLAATFATSATTTTPVSAVAAAVAASSSPPPPLYSSQSLPGRPRYPAARSAARRPAVQSVTAHRAWVAVLVLLTVYQIIRVTTYSLAFMDGDSVATAQQHAGRQQGPPQPPPPSKVTVSVFTAPKPFDGPDRENQLRAIHSWVRTLAPRAKKLTIHLLGDADGVSELCQKYGWHWVRNVDTNFLGVPLFNSVVDVASRSSSDIVILLNSDIIMLDDFFYALQKVRYSFPKGWMALAARWDVDSLPSSRPTNSDAWRVHTANFARDQGRLHTYGGIDLWVWNNSPHHNHIALVQGSIPHFVFGRGKYDNWFTHQAIRNSARAVVDISEACTLVHLTHDHHLVVTDDPQNLVPQRDISGLTKSYWSQGKHEKFELFLNSYLADTKGSYKSQMGTILHAPFKLSSCYELSGICVFYRKRPHACRCEYSSFVCNAENDPYVVKNSRAIFCGLASGPESEMNTFTVDENEDQELLSGRTGGYGTYRRGTEVVVGMPMLLQHLLYSLLGNDSDSPVIIATTATYERRSLMMNFVCNMRRLRVSNYVVAALDDEVYHFAVTRGIAVYLEYDQRDEDDSTASSVREWSVRPELARLQVAARILDLGVDVIFAQDDLVWLQDPMILYRQLDIPDGASANRSGPEMAFVQPGENHALSTSIFVAKVSVRNPFNMIVDQLSRSGPQDEVHSEDVGGALFTAVCGEDGARRVGQRSCSLPANDQKEVGEGSAMFLPSGMFARGTDRSAVAAPWLGIFSPLVTVVALYWSEIAELQRTNESFAPPEQALMAKRVQIESGYGFVDLETDLCMYPD